MSQCSDKLVMWNHIAFYIIIYVLAPLKLINNDDAYIDLPKAGMIVNLLSKNKHIHRNCSSKKSLEKTECAIKNGHSSDAVKKCLKISKE